MTNAEIIKQFTDNWEYPGTYHKDDIEKMLNQARKDEWDSACQATLNSISQTFYLNAHKAERLSDKEVFIAIAETIKNFPHPEYFKQSK